MPPAPSSPQLATRLFVEPDLATDMPVPLAADKAHFLGRVLRLAESDVIGLFNGRDGFWRARIAELGKRQAVLVPEQQLAPQPAVRRAPMLVMPPIKKARADWLIEKATELGVARIQPVITEYTAIREVNVERWRKITIEAAEQCERLDLPVIEPIKPLAAFLREWPRAEALHVAVERAAAVSLPEAATKSPIAAILIGPEGGFAAAELDDFAKLPFLHDVSLGTQVLRAETAAIAALAALAMLTVSDTPAAP